MRTNRLPTYAEAGDYFFRRGLFNGDDGLLTVVCSPHGSGWHMWCRTWSQVISAGSGLGSSVEKLPPTKIHPRLTCFGGATIEQFFEQEVIALPMLFGPAYGRSVRIYSSLNESHVAFSNTVKEVPQNLIIAEVIRVS
jgi:hypothetical protein